METIIILPKDVTVTFYPETNEIEIKINKETMLEKETGDLLMENLFSELGDYDIVQCNEINPTTDTWVTVDGKIYVITPKDLKTIKESGEVKLPFYGLLKDNIDLEMECDRDFILWFYNADTIEEAVETMNKTLV